MANTETDKLEKVETPYDQVDGNALLEVCIAILQNQEKVYGPVYVRLAKKNIMQFEANKTGENPPESSQEWDWSQVKEYLKKNFEKYPFGFNALIYSMGKTEATLQGSTGTSQRIGTTIAAKQMETNQPGKASNLEEAWKQSAGKLAFFKIMPTQVRYKLEDEKTVKYVVDNCPFKDGCDEFHVENIRKAGGNHICSLGRIMSSDIGQKIGAGCDYFVDQFADPNCIGRIKQMF